MYNTYDRNDEMITSVQNQKIKTIKKLTKNKDRQQEKSFIIEGMHLIDEAFKSDWEIKQLVISEDFILPKHLVNLDYLVLADNVFTYLSETKTPQGILAIVKMKENIQVIGNKLLALDAVQDPGNVGTLIRTADAAGYDGVVLGKGTADMFNEKTIRASQGSIFHIPVISKELEPFLLEKQAIEYKIYTTSLMNAVDYKSVDKQNKFILVMGNEGSGVSEEIMKLSNLRLHIPIHGEAESLNVAVAAGILMYELKS